MRPHCDQTHCTSHSLFCLTVGVTCIALLETTNADPPNYTAIRIGGVDDPYEIHSVKDINDSGVLTGSVICNEQMDYSAAYRWEDADNDRNYEIEERQELHGRYAANTTWGYAINNLGMVAGMAGFSIYDITYGALWHDGETSYFGHEIVALNDSGDLVTHFGGRQGLINGARASVRIDNVDIRLGALDNAHMEQRYDTLSQLGFAINNNGIVLGTSYAIDRQLAPADSGYITGPFPYAWQDRNGNHAWEVDEMLNMGVFFGRNSVARALNNQNDILINRRLASDSFEPFLFRDWNDNWRADPEELTVLDHPEGVTALAHAINDQGQIVGSAGLSPPDAVIWMDGVMYDLNSFVKPELEVHLVTASAINNNGWILCEATRSSSEEMVEAFVLIPITSGVTESKAYD